MKDEKNSHPYFNRSFISNCKNVLYWLSIIVVAFIVYQNYLSEDKEKVFNYDFRKTKWGMSLETVKAIEKSELVKIDLDNKNKQSLEYKGHDDFFVFNIRYRFIRGKLGFGIYDFIIDYSSIEEYIKQYKLIKEKVTEKYGEPEKKVNNLEQESQRFIDLLITEWQTYSSNISLVLWGTRESNIYFISLRYSPTKNGHDLSYEEELF